MLNSKQKHIHYITLTRLGEDNRSKKQWLISVGLSIKPYLWMVALSAEGAVHVGGVTADALDRNTSGDSLWICCPVFIRKPAANHFLLLAASQLDHNAITSLI